MEGKYIIRKFSRDGCRPCLVLQNALDAHNREIEERGAELVEHNIGQEPELIEKYGLASVPVLVFERNGVEITRINGLCAIEEIFDAISEMKEAD